MLLRRVLLALVLSEFKSLNEFHTGLPGVYDLINVPQFGSLVWIGKSLSVVVNSFGPVSLVKFAFVNDVNGAFGAHDRNLSGGISIIDIAANMLA